MNKPDISWLFDTGALKIAPAASPFWYTSGLIGPYYINTQFLCGGAEKANEILELIGSQQENHQTFHIIILDTLNKVYESHEIYHQIIDLLLDAIEREFPVHEIDYVTGGQRRDWFFSPILADKLKRPALYLYNDQSIFDAAGGPVTDLQGKKCLNAADLLTVGSSYTKKWIPALAKLGGTLAWSINGVDRNQNGIQNLTEAGVEKVYSLFSIDLSLFDEALQSNYIDQGQYDLVKGYLENPYESMRQFLINHPEFLENALQADEKTQKRANLLISENLYNLDS